MSNEVIIDGCNILEERKFLIHTDKYSIGEDGLIDGKIPFTDICYDLAKQLKRLEAKNEQLKQWYKEEKESNDKLQGLYQDEHCDNLKYKQALEDIKNNIANDEFKHNLIKKINEVLND